MPVQRDPRTKNWFFRVTVKCFDGTKKRAYGVPGTPGEFQEFANTKVGALAAEQRAKELALRPRIVEAKPTLLRTIRQHAENFVELYKPGSKPSETRGKTYMLDGYLLPFFGDMTIEALLQSDVDRFASNEIKRGMAIKTVNNRLAVLSTLIRYVTGAKPKLRFKLQGMPGAIMAVAMADVEKLLAKADTTCMIIVLLAAEAGLRAGEIRGLQWNDVKAGQVTVRRSLDNVTNEAIAPKHNKSRTIPLSPRIVAALATMPQRGLWIVSRTDGHLLSYERMNEAISSLYDLAEVTRPPKPTHCLRHTFGTEMAKRVPLGVLQQLMGHSEVTTTMRYVDVSEGDKREAIASVFGGTGAAAK